MRLIDADAFIEDARMVGLDTAEKVLFALSHQPTVEPKRGEWIETSEGTMCGNCHKFPYDDDEYHIANWHSDYCPNCGADMRGEAMRLIDADVLIEKCGEYYTEEGSEEGFIGTLKQLLNKQPTIEPKQEWIPCSERLPNEDGTYLVTDEWVGKTGTKYIEIEGIDFEHGRWNCLDYEKVTAWMPLPKPWKGRDNEKRL